MKEIHGLAEALYKSDRAEVQKAIKRIISICFAANKEGILALEEVVVQEEETYIGKHFLKKAVINLVDGSDPKELDDLMTNRILAETESKKQFICLLYKTGVNIIALGKSKNMRCVEDYISSLFPEACVEEVELYIRNIIDRHYAEEFERKKEIVPGKFRKISLALPAGVDEELKRLEDIILEKSTRQVQNILRNADHLDVCSLLLAGTEEFRNRILNNMSSRLRIMIMEDVIERGKEFDEHYNEEVENVKTAIDRMKKYLLEC